jgi:hypothetical protein
VGYPPAGRLVLVGADDLAAVAGRELLVDAVLRPGGEDQGKNGVIASGKLEKGGRDSNSETFHRNPAGERIPPGRA